MYIYVYVYTHIYIYTYLHIHIHTYIHTYIQTDIQTSRYGILYCLPTTDPDLDISAHGTPRCSLWALAAKVCRRKGRSWGWERSVTWASWGRSSPDPCWVFASLAFTRAARLVSSSNSASVNVDCCLPSSARSLSSSCLARGLERGVARGDRIDRPNEWRHRLGGFVLIPAAVHKERLTVRGCGNICHLMASGLCKQALMNIFA